MQEKGGLPYHVAWRKARPQALVASQDMGLGLRA